MNCKLGKVFKIYQLHQTWKEYLMSDGIHSRPSRKWISFYRNLCVHWLNYRERNWFRQISWCIHNVFIAYKSIRPNGGRHEQSMYESAMWHCHCHCHCHGILARITPCVMKIQCYIISTTYTEFHVRGTVSSRSVQAFNRAWNRCPSLR